MIRRSFALNDFLSFSTTMDNETRHKLFGIADAHPVIKNHPLMKRILENSDTYVTIYGLENVQETILKHSIKLAKSAQSSDPHDCLKVIMEQNVLNAASLAIGTLIIEHLSNNIAKMVTLNSVEKIDNE